MKAYLKIDKRNSEMWHSRQRSALWDTIVKGRPVLQDWWNGCLSVRYGRSHVMSIGQKYDPVACLYRIHFTLYAGTDNGSTRTWRSEDAIFEHIEEQSEFPSEHLKAKLMLLVG